MDSGNQKGKEAAGKSALIHHSEDWRAADVIRVVRLVVIAAGILQTPVWQQLNYGHAINFAVERPDCRPPSAHVQMTACRGKTAVPITAASAKEKPDGQKKSVSRPTSLSVQQGLICLQLSCFPWMASELST